MDRLGPVDEAELAFDKRIGLLALVVALPVPLVDGYDERAARIPDDATRRSLLEQVSYHRQLAAIWTVEIGKTQGGRDEPVER